MKWKYPIRLQTLRHVLGHVFLSSHWLTSQILHSDWSAGLGDTWCLDYTSCYCYADTDLSHVKIFSFKYFSRQSIVVTEVNLIKYQ